MNRFRYAMATLASRPWRRAPLLLWRHPGLLAAVAGATAVVAASLASVPLFTSVGSASVQLQADERCPRDLGATRRVSTATSAIRTPSPDPFVPVADRLGPRARTMMLVVERLADAGTACVLATHNPIAFESAHRVLELCDARFRGWRGG